MSNRSRVSGRLIFRRERAGDLSGTSYDGAVVACRNVREWLTKAVRSSTGAFHEGMERNIEFVGGPVSHVAR